MVVVVYKLIFSQEILTCKFYLTYFLLTILGGDIIIKKVILSSSVDIFLTKNLNINAHESNFMQIIEHNTV